MEPETVWLPAIKQEVSDLSHPTLTNHSCSLQDVPGTTVIPSVIPDSDPLSEENNHLNVIVKEEVELDSSDRDNEEGEIDASLFLSHSVEIKDEQGSVTSLKIESFNALENEDLEMKHEEGQEDISNEATKSEGEIHSGTWSDTNGLDKIAAHCRQHQQSVQFYVPQSDEEQLNSSSEQPDGQFSCDDVGHGSPQLNDCTQKEPPYTCVICEKSFLCRDSVTKHMLTHTDERPHVCEVCNKSFKQTGHLTTHLQTHTGIRPYSCSTCKKPFARRRSLKTHALVHTSRPYACVTCHESFTLCQDLSAHLRVHTNQPLYTCDICSKSFKHKRLLATHRFTHTRKRPYVCDICNKSYKYKSHLKIHVQLHTGYRPYTCDTCNKSFVWPSALKTHSLLHTRQQQYTCQICHKSFKFGDLAAHQCAGTFTTDNLQDINLHALVSDRLHMIFTSYTQSQNMQTQAGQQTSM